MALTRLLCRMIVEHETGTVHIMLREQDAKKRCVEREILTIHNCGHLPQIKEGVRFRLDCLHPGLDVEREETTLHKTG